MRVPRLLTFFHRPLIYKFEWLASRLIHGSRCRARRLQVSDVRSYPAGEAGELGRILSTNYAGVGDGYIALRWIQLRLEQTSSETRGFYVGVTATTYFLPHAHENNVHRHPLT